jgi:TrmH family RNA methyltransferase
MSALPHRLILIEPEIPENIGFVVRAMACFGWQHLTLVGCPKPEPESPAWRTATMGKEILESCRCVATLEEALDDSCTSIAFTRRPHQKGLHDLPDLSANSARLDAPWALVFGRESIGMTSDEVLACDYACRIPTVHATGSLNLGQAVSIALAFFHQRPARTPPTPSHVATASALRERWIRSTMQDVDLLGLIPPARREAGRRHLMNLLRRLRPNRDELHFLTSLLAKLTSTPKTRDQNLTSAENGEKIAQEVDK